MSNESKGRQEETLASGEGGGEVRDERVVWRIASNTLRSRDFQMMIRYFDSVANPQSLKVVLMCSMMDFGRLLKENMPHKSGVRVLLWWLGRRAR